MWAQQTLVNQSLFFQLDSFDKLGCGLVGMILWDEFAAYCEIEDGGRRTENGELHFSSN